MTPISEATVQVVEEAIVNALIGAETMTGVNVVYSIPYDRFKETP